jgi:hypothetical protein
MGSLAFQHKSPSRLLGNQPRMIVNLATLTDASGNPWVPRVIEPANAGRPVTPHHLLVEYKRVTMNDISRDRPFFWNAYKTNKITNSQREWIRHTLFLCALQVRHFLRGEAISDY